MYTQDTFIFMTDGTNINSKTCSSSSGRYKSAVVIGGDDTAERDGLDLVRKYNI